MVQTRADKAQTNGISKPEDSGYPPRTANRQPYTKSPTATTTTSPAKSGGALSFGSALGRSSSEQTTNAPAAPAPTQQMAEKDSAVSLVRNSTRGGAAASSPAGGRQSPGGRVYDKSPATPQVTNATASSDPLTPTPAAASRNPKRTNTSILSSPPPYAVVNEDLSPFEDTSNAGDVLGGFPPPGADAIEYAGRSEHWSSKGGRIDDSDQDVSDDMLPGVPGGHSDHPYAREGRDQRNRLNKVGSDEEIYKAANDVQRFLSSPGMGAANPMRVVPDGRLRNVPQGQSSHPYAQEGRDARNRLKRGGSEEEIYKAAEATQRLLPSQGTGSRDLTHVVSDVRNGHSAPQYVQGGRDRRNRLRKDDSDEEIYKAADAAQRFLSKQGTGSPGLAHVVPEDVLPHVPSGHSTHAYAQEGRDHRNRLRKGCSDEEIYKSADAARRFLYSQSTDSPELMDVDDKDGAGGLKPDQKATTGECPKGKKKDKTEPGGISFPEGIHQSANAAQRFLSSQGTDSPDLLDVDAEDDGGGLKPDRKAISGKVTKGKKKDKDEPGGVSFRNGMPKSANAAQRFLSKQETDGPNLVANDKDDSEVLIPSPGLGLASLALIPLLEDVAKDTVDLFAERWRDPSGNLTAPQIEAIYRISPPPKYEKRFQNSVRAVNGLSGSKTSSTFYGGQYTCDLAVQGKAAVCDCSSCSICLAIRTGFDKLELGTTEHVGVHGKGIYTNINPFHAHRFTAQKGIHPFRAMILCSVIKADTTIVLSGRITAGLFDSTGRVYCRSKSTIIPRQLIVYNEPPDLRRAG